MTARDSAPARGYGGNRAGHLAIAELLRAQEQVAPRSRAARLVGLSPLSHDTAVLYRGVVGELEVGEALDRLGPGWVVLHALPVAEDAADIDHLVIGPSGVHLVATHAHSGANVWASQRTFIAGDVRYPHIRDLEHEIGRAERMLAAAVGHPVEVSGILAVVASKTLTVVDRHRDVAVLPAPGIVGWLQRRRPELLPSNVIEIAAAAARSTTWFESGVQSDAPESLRERFEQLRAEVRHAAKVQLGWTIGLAAVVVLALAGTTWSIVTAALRSVGI